MSGFPHFSIITVCRNEREKIRATCESICSQSFRGFEWIVIDGASTDGTLETLDEYKAQIDVLVSEPDGGIYNAMNKGIGRASGAYLVFMNGGDRFADAGVLQAVSDAPAKDVLYGDLLFDGPEKMEKRYPDVLPPSYLLDNMLPHQSTFIRRTLFERFGVYDETFKIAGDYDFFARVFKEGEISYHHVPATLAVFDADGISKNPAYRALRKRENHRIRNNYFPAYRYSLKGLRQALRNRFGGG